MPLQDKLSLSLTCRHFYYECGKYLFPDKVLQDLHPRQQRVYGPRSFGKLGGFMKTPPSIDCPVRLKISINSQNVWLNPYESELALFAPNGTLQYYDLRKGEPPKDQVKYLGPCKSIEVDRAPSNVYFSPNGIGSLVIFDDRFMYIRKTKHLHSAERTDWTFVKFFKHMSPTYKILNCLWLPSPFIDPFHFYTVSTDLDVHIFKNSLVSKPVISYENVQNCPLPDAIYLFKLLNGTFCFCTTTGIYVDFKLAINLKKIIADEEMLQESENRKEGYLNNASVFGSLLYGHLIRGQEHLFLLISLKTGSLENVLFFPKLSSPFFFLSGIAFLGISPCPQRKRKLNSNQSNCHLIALEYFSEKQYTFHVQSGFKTIQTNWFSRRKNGPDQLIMIHDSHINVYDWPLNI